MKQLKTTEMREIANTMSEFLYIRTEDGDIRKKVTKAQKNILSSVIFSALSTMVWRSSSASIEYEKQAVCDMAETMVTLAIPDCNGYLTVYSPLKSLFSELEKAE